MQVDDSPCEVYPEADVALYVVEDELEEAVGEDGLAIVHYELFLERRFVAGVQTARQLTLQGLAPQQTAQVSVVLALHQPRVVEELAKGHP